MSSKPHVKCNFRSAETMRDISIRMPDGLIVPFTLVDDYRSSIFTCQVDWMRGMMMTHFDLHYLEA